MITAPTSQEAFQIGSTILSQISIATKMRSGARDFVAGNLNPIEGVEAPGVMFRVTNGSQLRTFCKIIITLDMGNDLYDIRLVKISRKTLTCTTIEECKGVYADMLDELVCDMVS